MAPIVLRKLTRAVMQSSLTLFFLPPKMLLASGGLILRAVFRQVQ
jgi:hypothetical protein